MGKPGFPIPLPAGGVGRAQPSQEEPLFILFVCGAAAWTADGNRSIREDHNPQEHPCSSHLTTRGLPETTGGGQGERRGAPAFILAAQSAEKRRGPLRPSALLGIRCVVPSDTQRGRNARARRLWHYSGREPLPSAVRRCVAGGAGIRRRRDSHRGVARRRG